MATFCDFLTEQNSERNSVWRCWSIPQVSQWRESRSWSAPTILKRRMCPVQQVVSLSSIERIETKTDEIRKAVKNFDWSLTMLICLGIGPFFSLMTVVLGSWLGFARYIVTKTSAFRLSSMGVVHDQGLLKLVKKRSPKSTAAKKM